LNIDIPFRVSTLKLISKLIIELSESKDQKVAISQENLLSFNEGYRNSIMKVLRFLQNSIIGDLFSEIFEMQWKDIYKQPFNKIKRKDYVFTLIPLIEEQQPGISDLLVYLEKY